MKKPSLPHFLRVTQTLALVSGATIPAIALVASACSSDPTCGGAVCGSIAIPQDGGNYDGHAMGKPLPDGAYYDTSPDTDAAADADADAGADADAAADAGAD